MFSSRIRKWPATSTNKGFKGLGFCERLQSFESGRTVVVDLDALALKVGEDVLVAHQKVAGDQHKVKVDAGRVLVVLRHQFQDPLHRQTLQGMN